MSKLLALNVLHLTFQGKVIWSQAWVGGLDIYGCVLWSQVNTGSTFLSAFSSCVIKVSHLSICA